MEKSENKLFNVNLCIVCQIHRNTAPLTSTDNGMSKIRHVSKFRQDEVYHRLNLLSTNDKFYYHLKHCYKNYTHKSYIKYNGTEKDPENDETDIEPLPSVVQCQTRLSLDLNCCIEKCVVCGKLSNKKVKTLHTLTGDDRAKLLFDATRFLQDDVFIRTSTLDSPEAFLNSKLKYHSHCIRSYEHEYDRSKNTKSDSVTNKSLEINNAIFEVIKSLESRINLGEVFSLNDILTLIIEKYGSDFSVKHSKIKSCLIDYYEEKICFTYPKQKNKSQLFYLSKINSNCSYDFNKEQNVISECAKIIKDSLKKIEFQLENKFCDENDLKLAWNNMNIPKPIITFFSELFECNKEDIVTDCDDINCSSKSTKDIKLLRIKCFIQVMYFIQNRGFKKTPIHTLLGLFVHKTTKSKTTITILNRLGLSISYDEVLRIRTRLAAYATEVSLNCVPLPSHFDVNGYVTAAFDNFDHNEATLSGLNSTHDAVSVIFQEQEATHNKKKPDLSDVPINKFARSFLEKLKCQEIKDYQRKKSSIDLPTDYQISNQIQPVTTQSIENNLLPDDFAWALSRIKFLDNKQIEIQNEIQIIPSWNSFYSTLITDNRPKQKVGYLPIIPNPITEYSTVYTCLCNFNSLLSQLNQQYLPITCDEGVYKIARTIIFENPKEFENLVLCLGSFHLTKVFQSCIGKYLKNSGIENVFIESGLFGMNVVNQILTGGDYARCTKAFNFLSEALRRLQVKEFFAERSLEKYEEQLITIMLLKESFEEDNYDESKHFLHEFRNKCSKLLSDFHSFVSIRCNESELFKYWNNVLILITLMQDLIRADRTGNWELHINTLEKIQPIFHIMDRTNYSRWSSVYLEDMRMLEEKAPEVYREYIKGRFTVRRSSTPFTSVATDQALEQTINRDSKTTAGIIGFTKKKETIALWDITYHELLAIANFMKELTFVSDDDYELSTHHDFSATKIKSSEIAVGKIIQYLEDKNGNPFIPGSQLLRNIITQELVKPEVTTELLNIISNGIKIYEIFRKERFCDKTKSFSSVIKRYNLPDFKSNLKPVEQLQSKKFKKSHNSETQRIVALANERNYPIQELLKYELSYKNQLFGDDGLFKKENNKSLLTRELEKVLGNDKINMVKSDSKTCLVIDVMLVLRKLSWKDLNTFKDLATEFLNFVVRKVTLHNTTRVDFVFDSYFEKSLKSTEHLRRHRSEFITYNSITETTTLPKQEEKFWSSSENKILLQKCIQNFIKTYYNYCNLQLIFSTINDITCTAINVNLSSLNLLQRNDIEEADLKIILHINHAVLQGYTNCYIISSDTDVVVLALYFFNIFKQNGLQTLWIRVGVGKSTRDIPLHSLAINHGEKMCSVLPALHHLTGSDYTSKVGTKLAALQANPEKYLLHFGKECSEFNVQRIVDMAEEYLVNVVKKGTQCKTFNSLRVWSYYHAKCMSVEDLPPTSDLIRLHILRCLYIVYNQVNCLNTNMNLLNPKLYGWKEEDDLLVPEVVHILLPPSYELVPNCTCKVCTRKTCCCVAAEIACCSFCFCQKNSSCKNSYNK